MNIDDAVIVVSGLPRSGTSMAMSMLDAGGVEIMTDRIRKPDESNPKGYFEYERVQRLAKESDTSWVSAARGRAVKVVSSLLTFLPATNAYKVIFVHRNLKEVVASQSKMMAHRGTSGGPANDDEMIRLYEQHLKQVAQLLAERPCFDALDIGYADILERPAEQAERMNEFLGGQLDPARMAEVVDAALYRNRA